MENKEVKKSKKGKIIAIIVAVIVIIVAVLVWYSGIIGGISSAEAQDIARQQVPGSAENSTITVVEDFDDMRKTYEVQLTYENMLYEFQILARNGKILNQESEQIGMPQTTQPSDQAPAAGDIGVEKAKEIALSNVSGAAATDITKASLDNENGKLIYEIEIIYNGTDYDYDIDAATGEVISSSSESVHN